MSTYTPVPLKETDPSPYSRTLHPAGGSTDHHHHHHHHHAPHGLKERVRRYAGTIEAAIEKVFKPLKPHLNKFARFLLVSTFLEDALRITNQFWEQKEYLIDEQEYHDWFVIGFLLSNVLLMVVCSILIVFKKWSLFAFAGLVTVIVSQGWVYELMTDTTFLCLNLSILGALMLALSDTLVGGTSTGGSRRGVVGLPDISEDVARKRQTYLQLAGRIMLVVFFVGHALVAWVELAYDSFNILHLITAILSLIACLLVAVGFKAVWSALFLVIVTSVVNVLSNDWWTKPKDHPERDFRRFDFFQALSVVGGMILLINQGPGRISFDAKRKSI
ncbi:hypothetical protein PCANC_03678 [Puccinia coronata f. sp. avenae]|uniref:Surfeit locus protein 4 n=1 Tax=Puccinia coronata f. sp. avenae TaxID=200324 RepID=A0A2N5VXP9_9BASI|nr:hypothetical protein PCANC_03678 [Puccinia coronata f. sp. avenae]